MTPYSLISGIKFTDIAVLIRKAMDASDAIENPTVEEILEAETKAAGSVAQMTDK